ncbi:MAG: WYL domain-containing protein [Alphaproteobacteria bacterium]|nr:WYL domain-containing protein [Alphaproteobacteria bacterium]
MDKKSEQWMRKLKFIAEVRKNNYPTAENFAKKLTMYEGEDGQPFGCSARTIARDIKDLVEIHKAPLEYDARNRGYYLRDRSWRFEYPVFEEDFISMAMLGTRLATDILPDPLKKDVDDAVSQTLAMENSNFFDTAMIDTILCASGIKSSIDPAVFKRLFDAWRMQQMVVLTYRNPKGEISEHRFEPHLIVFHKGIWYAKGYKYGTKEIRLYAVQRIVELHNGGDSFELDKKLLEDTRKKGLFNYEKVSGIRLHCDASIAFYIYEQQKVFQSQIERQDDDSLIVTLNPTVEHEVIRWILAEAGRIQVLEPESLRKKIAAAGKNIMEKNS